MRSSVSPNRALVGSPEGLFILPMAWNTWKMSPWPSSRYRVSWDEPEDMVYGHKAVAGVARRGPKRHRTGSAWQIRGRGQRRTTEAWGPQGAWTRVARQEWYLG